MTSVRASSERSVIGHGQLRQTLIIVSGIVCFETVLFTILGPLLPHLAHRFDLSKSAAGVLVASYGAGAFLGAVPSGVVAARAGAKRAALTGLLLLGGASVVFGVAPSAAWLFAARFIQGVGCSLAWTGGFAWLLVQAPRDRRGAVMGTALAAAVAGALVGPAGGALASSFGTKLVFVALAAPAFALAAWGATIPAGPAQELATLPAFRRALTQRNLLKAALMIVLAGFLLGILSVLTPLHLARVGFSSTVIGAIFVLAAAVNTAASPVLGRWADRAGRLPPLRTAFALSAAGSVALAWGGGHWTYALIVFATGVSYSLLWTPSMVLLSDAADEGGIGFVAGFALLNLAWSPGQLVGSAFGGAAAQVSSDAVPYGVAAVLCVGALASLGSRGTG